MREFGAPISEDVRQQLMELIDRLYGSAPAKREVTAGEFAMEDFKAAQTDARAHNRGLWGGCNVNESTDIKQTAGAKSSLAQ